MIRAQAPTPSGAPDPDLVTPGTIGFLVTFFIVIFVVFLIRDALKRVRRVRARAVASDAYPIPLRKHAVPNQSTLSGAKEPEPTAEEAGAGSEPSRTAAEAGEETGAERTGPRDPRSSRPEQTRPEQTQPEQTEPEPDGRRHGDPR